MNMNQIVNMIIRMLTRKAVNSGINAGIGMASGLGRRQKSSGDDAQPVTEQERARERQVRKSVGQAKKMTRISRRITRL